MLTPREEQILLCLKKFDYMTRDQIRTYFKLGSIRNTNRILLNLNKYLKNIRIGYDTIYYLSKVGKEYVDCEKVRKSDGQIKHILMRNDLWLFQDSPLSWKNEIKVSDGKTTVIVDAMFKDSWERQHFVEIDHKQSMNENRKKIKRYRELYENGLIENKLGHFPTLLWLTTTEHRRTQLKKACEDFPAVIVYTVDDIR